MKMGTLTKTLILTVDEMAFLYMIIIGALLRIVTISDVSASFLALPFVVILPYLFGKTVMKLCNFLTKGALCFISCYQTSFYVVSWMVGSFALAVTFFITTLLQLSIVVQILPFLAFGFIALNLIQERIHKRAENVFNLHFKNRALFSLCAIVVVVAIAEIFLTKTFQPFPLIWGRTYFLTPNNVQAPYRVVESGYFTGSRWPDHLFPTIALSIPNVEPLHFLWASPFILSALYSLGIFVLSYGISKKLEIATLSAILSIFVNPASLSYPRQFITLNSNAIMRVVFPWILYTIYKTTETHDRKIKDNIIFTIFLGLSLGATFFSLRRVFLLTGTPEWTRAWTLFVESTLFPLVMLFLPFLGALLSFLLKERQNRNTFFLIFLVSSIYFSMHVDESILYVVALVVFTAVCLSKKNLSKPLVLILGLVTVSLIGLQWVNILNINSSGLISSLWNPELQYAKPIDIFDIKKVDFEFAYRELTIIFLLLGSFFALKTKRKGDRIMSTMLFAMLLLFFLPEYQTLRAYSQLSPFIAYVLAISILSITSEILRGTKLSRLKKGAFSNLSLRTSHYQIRFPPIDKTASGIIAVTLLVALAPSLVTPIYEHFSTENSQYPYSIADYEYEAAYWIKRNLPETTILLSDYQTILLLSSLGNKIWLTDKGMSGTTISLQSQEALRIMKFDILRANNSREAFNNILSLPEYFYLKERRYVEYAGLNQKNMTFAVVLSSRTAKWIEQESMDDMIHCTYAETPGKYLELFNNSEYFELLYKIEPYLFIYEVQASFKL